MTEDTTAPAVTGVHHFSLTVSDVEASAEWYGHPRSGMAIGLQHPDNIQLELFHMASS